MNKSTPCISAEIGQIRDGKFEKKKQIDACSCVLYKHGEKSYLALVSPKTPVEKAVATVADASDVVIDAASIVGKLGIGVYRAMTGSLDSVARVTMARGIQESWQSLQENLSLHKTYGYGPKEETSVRFCLIVAQRMAMEIVCGESGSMLMLHMQDQQGKRKPVPACVMHFSGALDAQELADAIRARIPAVES